MTQLLASGLVGEAFSHVNVIKLGVAKSLAMRK